MDKRYVEEKLIKLLQNDNALLITADTDLVDDLQYDSLMFVELIIKIENEFNIEIPDEMLDIDVLRKYGFLENFLISVNTDGGENE